MTVLYVNADWSAIVPAGSVEAAFGIDEPTARARGLLPLAEAEKLVEPETTHSANEATKEPEEPEAKEADKPADKAVKKPRTKQLRTR